MSAISFEKRVKTSRFHNPLDDFNLAEIESEVRWDPLTGQTGRVCHFQTGEPEQPDYKEMAQRTREAFCPFCPEHVLDYTPTFASEAVPDDRLQSDNAVLFPNLAPYDEHSCVAVYTDQHFVPLHEFSPESFVEGLSLAQRYVGLVCDAEDDACFPLINWNYMPMSGGSQIHPHLQVVVTSTPGNTIRQRAARSREYRREHGSSYWDDLIRVESERGERYVSNHRGVDWLVPFVPSGVLGDALAVFPDTGSFLECSEEGLRAFADGLSRVLQGLDRLGVRSLNMGFYSVPRGEETPSFPLHAIVTPRFTLSPQTNSTDWASIQILYGDTFAVRPPEDLATKLRSVF